MTAQGVRRTPLAALIVAYLVSGTGTTLSAVAIPWLVLLATGSPVATGVVGFAEMAPYVILQAIGGPLVDRLGLRRSFLLGNLVAAAAVFLVFLLDALDRLPIGVLVVLVAIAGAVRGAADSSATPMIPPLARRAGWTDERAIGLYSAASRAALLVGMPLAGVLVALIGAPVTILFDSLSFLAAVVLVALFVPTLAPEAPADPAGRNGARAYLAQLREGFRFLRADRLLTSLMAMIVVTNLLDQAMSAVLLPVWAHDRVHDAVAFGLVGGASGLGMLSGVLLAAWVGQRLPRWVTFAVCTLVSAAPPFFAVAGWTSVVAVMAVFCACGVFGGVPNPIIGAVEYERVPAVLQTRVLGAIRASAYLGVPFGSLLGGFLAQTVGLTWACIAAGAIMLAVTTAPFVFPVWHGMNRSAPEPAPASAP